MYYGLHIRPTGVWRPTIDNTEQNRDLIEAVIDFTSSVEKEFFLKDAVKAVKRLVGDVEGDLKQLVDEALHNDPWVFFDHENKSFVPRQSFFNGKKFLIAPTDMERKRGYIIPGHRFIPFAQRFVPPSNYEILGPDGKRLEFKQVQLRMEETQIFFTLFDYSRTIEFLVLEDENNAEVLLKASVDPGEEITMWVLDIPELLENDQTVFEMTVKNWRDGVFQLEPKVRHDGPEPRRKLRVWCDALEEILYDVVFDLLGPMTDLNEQAAWAMFLGEPMLSEEPEIHIGGFLAHLDSVQFTRVNGVPLFWRKDESPEDEIFEHLRPSMPMQGAKDSLDGILHDVGCSLREAELEAYMRDTLFKGKAELPTALENALRYRGSIDFIDEEQQEIFEAEVNKLWDRVSQGYNRFTDQRSGKCRSECLAIMDEVVVWMNSLDEKGVGMDALPKKEFVAISSLVTMITHTVSALNQGPEDISQDEIQALTRALDPLRNQADQLMQAINNKLFPPPSSTKAKRPVFRVIQGGLSDEE